jgi:paraquat-inducible protein A
MSAAVVTAAITAADLGLVSCAACGLLSRLDPGPGAPASMCPRCHSRLHVRKRDSLRRTTAYLVAAALAFFPANLLPVMTTTSPLGARRDTILSGVVELAERGSWALAVLVFVASIVVPVLKIALLALLVVTTRARTTRGRLGRTRIYRALERIGRWSMLDIFVMALLAALVHSQLAGVRIHAGAGAFAAVVILTMFASRSFDPRLIWDGAHTRQERDHHRG